MHTMQLNRSAPRGGVGTVQPRAVQSPTPPVSGLAAALGIRLMAYAMGEFVPSPAVPPTVLHRRRPSMG